VQSDDGAAGFPVQKPSGQLDSFNRTVEGLIS